MARWRAVPTAVSTAVGALAFLASTGLAIVLGAGLHVWSGPSTAGGASSPAPVTAPAVTGGVGGVVTVPPPAVSSPPSRSGTGTPPPVVALPFVPFIPATAPSSGSAASAPPSAPAVPTPVVAAPQPAAPDFLRGVSGPGQGLRSPVSTGGSDELLASVTDADRHAAGHGHHGHHHGEAKHHHHHHRHHHRHHHGHHHGHHRG